MRIPIEDPSPHGNSITFGDTFWLGQSGILIHEITFM
jgi:hypothetical protein